MSNVSTNDSHADRDDVSSRYLWILSRPEPAYTPPNRFVEFLNAGTPPIYVGFGSIIMEDPESIIDIILGACQQAGVRAIISHGWSKLGGDKHDTIDVLYMHECPHGMLIQAASELSKVYTYSDILEWLFKRVSAVVHHGGAGTTACGLFNSRPTVIVPFFGE